MAKILVLEWSRPAEEMAEYMAMLRAETEWDCWFCWSNQQVPGFGLTDGDQITPEGYAFQAATGGNMSAIDERAAQLGEEKLGAPLSEEVEIGGGVKLKAFYNGTLLEVPGAGVYAVAEATVADGFLSDPA